MSRIVAPWQRATGSVKGPRKCYMQLYGVAMTLCGTRRQTRRQPHAAVLGRNDPMWSRDDPVWGRNDPVWGSDDPVWGCDDPVWGCDDPVWGRGSWRRLGDNPMQLCGTAMTRGPLTHRAGPALHGGDSAQGGPCIFIDDGSAGGLPRG
jgi:hypothetical protein